MARTRVLENISMKRLSDRAPSAETSDLSRKNKKNRKKYTMYEELNSRTPE
jgi:hypothetical protein